VDTPIAPLQDASLPNIEVLPQQPEPLPPLPIAEVLPPAHLQPFAEMPSPAHLQPVAGVQPLVAPELSIPVRKSSRLANRPASKVSRLETAVNDSLASTNQIRTQREQRQLDLQELHARQENEVPVDADEELALALSSLDSLTSVAHGISAVPESIYESDPLSWAEAQSSAHGEDWWRSFQEELDSLNKMGVYDLIPQSSVPLGQKIHTGKPVFHVKRDADGNVCQRKVHLVFRGFEQIPGLDYDKTTSPTA
jgi:hypothetical protein